MEEEEEKKEVEEEAEMDSGHRGEDEVRQTAGAAGWDNCAQTFKLSDYPAWEKNKKRMMAVAGRQAGWIESKNGATGWQKQQQQQRHRRRCIE